MAQVYTNSIGLHGPEVVFEDYVISTSVLIGILTDKTHFIINICQRKIQQDQNMKKRNIKVTIIPEKLLTHTQSINLNTHVNQVKQE